MVATGVPNVLVLDIDGTTVTSQKCVDPDTKDALLQLQKQGIRLILASGRPPEGVYPIARQLRLQQFGGYIVAFNGSKVIEYKTKRCLYEQYLSKETLRSLWYDARCYGLGIMTYGKGKIITASEPDPYVRAESSWSHMPIVLHEDFLKHAPKTIYQCLLTGKPEQLQALNPLLSKLYLGKAEVFHSEPSCLEVTPCRVDKSLGLKKLFCHLDISPSQVVCCGDSYNDIGMLRYAGVGVAMANAPQAVKEFADYVTCRSNDERGIVEVVRQFFPSVLPA